MILMAKPSRRAAVSEDRKIFRTMAGAFCLLMAADLATTYAGVCVLGGTELNPVAAVLAYAGGFPLAAVAAMGQALFAAWLLAYYIRRNSWWFFRTMTVAVFALLMVSNMQAVIGNAAGLVAAVIQEPVPGQHPAAEPSYEAAFDRARFCRMWP